MLLLVSESSDKPKVFNTSKRTDNSQIPRLALQPSLSPNEKSHATRPAYFFLVFLGRRIAVDRMLSKQGLNFI